MKNIFVSCLIVLSTSVMAAWDDGAGIKQGIIQTIDVTGGNNYGFRVYLEGLPAMCAGGANWAYINEEDSNYNLYTSTLLLAFATGKKVAILSNTLSNTQYCHIGYIKILK